MIRSLKGLVRAMRPQQWVKNLFVFAPLLFRPEDWHYRDRDLRVVATFAIFCLLASGVYLVNDVADRAADLLHPIKKTRPIASGEVGVKTALVAAVVLIAAALTWARVGLYDNQVTAVCATYLAVQLAYTYWLKRVVVMDVLCIASGFVLRLLAGGTALWLQQSTWILVCTIFLSLFLALCKRRHEVVSLKDDAALHRPILADYPPALLDQFISSATAATLVTYALYTVDPKTAEAHRLLLKDGKPSPILAVTLPFVIFGMFRYLFLVHRRDEGGSPTSTLLRDLPSLLNGLAFLATVLAVFHFAGKS